ncbi:MAG: S41 family peptidase [Lachnospiraceae bacterium]|nr:S41 family peptidase [Lachnospiraceae bacterium]
MKKKIVVLFIMSSMVTGLSGCDLDISRSVRKNTTEETEIEAADDKDTSSSSDSNKDKKEKNSIFSSKSDNFIEDKDIVEKTDLINKYIDQLYYFEVDKDKQEEAYFDGIMAGLDDPYSVYYSQEDYSSLQEETSGEYVGIGAVVTQDADMVISVVRPIKGSPAEEAGIMAEDIIVEIDGEDVQGQDLNVVVKKIRGEEGSVAKVKVYRKSVSDYIEFDVKRRVVENYSVSNEMLEDNIGYIQIEQFYENTGKEFKDAMEQCQKDGAKGIIIDLRDNPGGLLNVVVDMCDYIMEGVTIVSTKDKNGTVLSEFKAEDGKETDIPMVVLINGNSASASEIFSGAMKDTGKAKLVGTTTFGKGIVQSVIPLEDGSAIKLTVAKYFTPNGNDIHEIGVAPDYVVELKDGKTTAVNLDRKEDTQLDKGVEVLKEMIK